MDKFLRGFISVEKAFQIFALVGVISFLGYLGLNNVKRDRWQSLPERESPAPNTSPTTQLK